MKFVFLVCIFLVLLILIHDAHSSPLPLRTTGSAFHSPAGESGGLLTSIKSAGRRFAHSVTHSFKTFKSRYAAASKEHSNSRYVPHSFSGPDARFMNTAQYL